MGNNGTVMDSLVLVRRGGGGEGVQLPARLSACVAPRRGAGGGRREEDEEEEEVCKGKRGKKREGEGRKGVGMGAGEEGRSKGGMQSQARLQGGRGGGVDAVVLGKIIVDEFVIRRAPEGKVRKP